MLRAIYRFVLRLHPPSFRRRFGEEILSIFDQSNAKRVKCRLLVDGLFSLGQQWAFRPDFWHGAPVETAPHLADGVPSFCTLDPFRPRTSAIVHGLVLSTAVFCMTCFAIRYSWIHVLHVRIREVQFESPQSILGLGANAVAAKPATVSLGTKDESSIPSPIAYQLPLNAPTDTTANTISDQNGVAQTSVANSEFQEGSEGAARSKPQSSSAKTVSAEFDNGNLNQAERKRAVSGAIANLNQYYVDPAGAKKMADALRLHDKNGDYNGVTDGSAFANLLTAQMREVSHDRHLRMVYNQVKTTADQPGPTPEDIARYRKDMLETNCTFESVKILAHNVGYLKFNSFPDPSICQSTAKAAMASLNDTDAIIFDLRDNGGGDPKMVALMASYLFEQPTHLDDFYNRSQDSTQESWTPPPVAGNKLTNKPAYVLISRATFSGAEEFSYDLKNLKRATLIGETTRGGAHMVSPHRIDEHFTIGVPDTRPINPISNTDWEGTGVEPDVKVHASDALQTAIKLAERDVQKG
jgi:hypothetical protein